MIAALVAFIVIAIVVLVFVNIGMSRRMENRSNSQTDTGKNQPEPVTPNQTQPQIPPATPTAGDLVNPVSGSIPETTESTFFPQRHHKDVDYRQALRDFAKPDSNTEVEPQSPTEEETAPISADEDYRQGLRSFAKRE